MLICCVVVLDDELKLCLGLTKHMVRLRRLRGHKINLEKNGAHKVFDEMLERGIIHLESCLSLYTCNMMLNFNICGIM